jgi:hypothetical protein
LVAFQTTRSPSFPFATSQSGKKSVASKSRLSPEYVSVTSAEPSAWTTISSSRSRQPVRSAGTIRSASVCFIPYMTRDTPFSTTRKFDWSLDAARFFHAVDTLLKEHLDGTFPISRQVGELRLRQLSRLVREFVPT